MFLFVAVVHNIIQFPWFKASWARVPFLIIQKKIKIYCCTKKLIKTEKSRKRERKNWSKFDNVHLVITIDKIIDTPKNQWTSPKKQFLIVNRYSADTHAQKQRIYAHSWRTARRQKQKENDFCVFKWRKECLKSQREKEKRIKHIWLTRAINNHRLSNRLFHSFSINLLPLLIFKIPTCFLYYYRFICFCFVAVSLLFCPFVHWRSSAVAASVLYTNRQFYSVDIFFLSLIGWNWKENEDQDFFFRRCSLLVYCLLLI